MRVAVRVLRECGARPHGVSWRGVREGSTHRRETPTKGGFSEWSENGFTAEQRDGEHSWICGSSAEVLTAVRANVQVLQNFISEEEEAFFLKELEPGLKRKRYEFDHWDDVRHHFTFVLVLMVLLSFRDGDLGFSSLEIVNVFMWSTNHPSGEGT